MSKIALVSLGCPKNLVDSEEILGTLVGNGCEIEPDCSRADVIIVNTCAFIESAKQESIEAILEVAQYKNTGRCRFLVVAGCLAQRYGEVLRDELPDVDAFVGIGQYHDLPSVIQETLDVSPVMRTAQPPEKWIESVGRVRSTPPWTAYLTISDGCDNRCAYCAIPGIRGRHRSRPPELVIAEAERLASEGTKELNIIGQDITMYGSDIEGEWTLEQLLAELVKVDVQWIRLLYCNPTRVSDELIERVAGEPKICKYMDLPLQHGDDNVLRRMGRRGRSREYLELIDRLRSACPEIALRSSFIVGFPGESEDEFENLLRFVERANFDRAGAFTYSREEGTRAAKLKMQVPRRVMEKRYSRLMQLQQDISYARNRALVGPEMEVLVESSTPALGRSYRDAPDIDGLVYLKDSEVKTGQFVLATITDAREYDLVAEIWR